jgi:hypothetical protein
MRKHLAILTMSVVLLTSAGRELLAATLPTLPNLKARWVGSAGTLEGDASSTEDGDFVYTWQDQSGNGNHAIGSGGTFFNPKWVAAAPEFNNQPVVRFAGLANHALQTLEAPNLNITGKNLTVFAVLRHTSGVAGEQGYLANYSSGNGFYLGETPTSNDKFIFFEGNNPPLDGASISNGASINAFHRARILAATVDTTTTTLYENRIVLGTTTSKNIGNSGTSFQIGFSNGFNNVFVGDFAEILVYDRGLSASELNDVTYYLEATYGIPEPGSLALVALAGVLAVRRPGRRPLA